MDGVLAQQMAIVAWGNEALAGRPHPAIDDHDTFRFVHSATFSPARKRRFRPAPPSTSGSAWLTDLRSNGVEWLELDARDQLFASGAARFAGRLRAAFARGVSTPIIATRSDAATVWRTSWSLAPGDRPADDRIWLVAYDNVGEIRRPTLDHPTVTAAAGRLAGALQAIHRFARQHDTGHWVEWFEESQALLSAQVPITPYYADFLPDHGLAHAQLTASTIKAWVFGGMGSWNDLGFPGDEAEREYEQVTSDLFAAVLYAVDAAANLRS